MSSVPDDIPPEAQASAVPAEPTMEQPVVIASSAEEPRSVLRDWGMVLVKKALQPLTIFGTPLFLLGLLIYFLVRAFLQGFPFGIRSLSAFLLPPVVFTFIFVFHRLLLTKLGTVDVVISYVVSLVWGILVMVVIELFTGMKWPVPLIELLLSATFSVLVFGFISLPQERIMSYFYGAISGMLVYMVFFGFPLARA